MRIIADSLAQVRARIGAAAALAGRQPGTVRLVAVAKTHGPEAVIEAYEAGARDFGENRVQEAAAKYPALKARWPDLRLHLIGPLQTNKAKQAVGLFDAIETVDRPKLARILAEEMRAQARRPDCFIQVNTGEEPQKAGVAPGEAVAFARECLALGLPVVGLMCIPPAGLPPGPHFALLAELAKQAGLKELSMGMSGDFETAVRLGATSVRVGSAIFGERT